ncbi:MAG: DUF4923 family protein [Bacteroidaceae bacterium]|nr:DUF4923 family protein [Bacteroidaceae bacterium]
MKKQKTFATLLISSSLLLAGCGAGTTSTATSTTDNTTGSTLGSILGAVAGSAIQGATSSAKTSANEVIDAINTNSAISGIIGILTNGKASANTIVGKWTYAEPTVQFESQNLLAKAGGAIAGNAIVNKILPYYEKAGIKNGVMSATFNEDKTCSIVMNGKTIAGTYTYDSSSNSLQVTSQLGIKLLTAYVTLSSNQMAITFDSSKLLNIATTLGAVSGNSTLSAISNIASSYDGMKTGFLFNRQ